MMKLSNHQLLEIITALQNDALAGQDMGGLFQRILDAFLQATDSAYGFIGEVLRGPTGQPYLKAFAITDISWNEETRRLYDEAQDTGMEFHNLDTLFGAGLRTAEVVIANSPATDPRAGGLPSGHPPLNAFMCVPLRRGDAFLGMVGMANRPGGYSASLAEALRPLTSTATALLRAQRAEQARQQAELEMREQKERLSLVISGTGVGLWDWRVQTGEVVFNERWAEIIGYKLDELAPITIETWLRYCHPEDLARSNAEIQQVFDGHLPSYECDVRMRHREGHWIWVRDTGRVIERDADGRPVRMVGTHMDITEERRFLEENINYRNQLETILEAAPDGIMTVDNDLRITRFNPAAEALFRRNAAELVGQPLSLLLTDKARPDHDTMALNFLRFHGGDPRPMAGWRTVEGLRGDGTTFPMLVTLSRTILDGQPSVVAVMRDVTLLEQQQSELRGMAKRLAIQLNAAEQANAAKTRFLASMSHELRTPLNAIIGFSDILSSPIGDTMSMERRKEYAADIMRAGSHLLSLINDLLDMARIEESRLELDARPLELRPLMEDVVRIMAPVMAEASLHFHHEPLAGPVTVMADARAVRQILINLLANASKFTPGEGTVTLTASPGPFKVSIAVSDTGRGIPADKIPQLGRPFVQVGDPWNSTSGGLGLGLAISRQLAEMMGGDLRIESRLGEGTTVRFTLPLAQPARVEPVSAGVME